MTGYHPAQNSRFPIVLGIMFEPRAEAQESVEEVLPPPDPSPDSLLPLGVIKLTDI